jgi:peptide/nickel transport system permease protein
MILVLALLCFLAAPPFMKAPAYHINMAERLLPPSAEHWFGTDTLGRDLLARVLLGGRLSLGIGLSTGLLSAALALLVGLYGCLNRILETLLLSFCDALRSVPALFMAIALTTALGGNLIQVLIVLVLSSTPVMARLVRSTALIVREQPYIEAARLQGAGPGRLLFYHVLPNILAPLAAQVRFTCAQAMLIEAALSFLGAGIPAPQPSWGSILQEGQAVMFSAPWMIMFPGICAALTILGINLLGGPTNV